jgi:hypothetical protein
MSTSPVLDMWHLRLAAGTLVAALVVADMTGWVPMAPVRATDRVAVEWRIDNVEAIGGHRAIRLGAPQVVETPLGPAVAFDGAGDALVVETNPLAGLAQFTLEVVFAPAADGLPEQRFLHFQEAGTEHRVMVETRLLEGRRWSLDTFLRGPRGSLPLLDRERAHPTGTWHVAALTYDGREMAHYVNGVRELSGEVAFDPLGEGTTSIGARLNRVSWFKGAIHSIRITPSARTSGEFLTVSDLSK